MKSTGVVKRSTLSRVLFVMTLRFVAVMVSGCATTNVNQAHKTPALFESIPSRDVAVSQIQAVEDGDGLLTYGENAPFRITYHSNSTHADSTPAPADDLLSKHNPAAPESKS